MAEVIILKTHYDISKMTKRAHPLQSKIDSGELKLIDPLDISEEALANKLHLLSNEEREFIILLKNTANHADV